METGNLLKRSWFVSFSSMGSGFPVSQVRAFRAGHGIFKENAYGAPAKPNEKGNASPGRPAAPCVACARSCCARHGCAVSAPRSSFAPRAGKRCEIYDEAKAKNKKAIVLKNPFPTYDVPKDKRKNSRFVETFSHVRRAER